MASTRERIVDASAELFRRQGYAATGIKQIVTEAQAPFGSIYHHFPGGKEQLGAEAIRTSGKLYELLIPAVFAPAPDLVTGVRMFFAGAAAPGSLAGRRGAAIPSTRIAFSPSDSFSRPSVDDTSSPVSSRTRSNR